MGDEFFWYGVAEEERKNQRRREEREAQAQAQHDREAAFVPYSVAHPERIHERRLEDGFVGETGSDAAIVVCKSGMTTEEVRSITGGVSWEFFSGEIQRSTGIQLSEEGEVHIPVPPKSGYRASVEVHFQKVDFYYKLDRFCSFRVVTGFDIKHDPLPGQVEKEKFKKALRFFRGPFAGVPGKESLQLAFGEIVGDQIKSGQKLQCRSLVSPNLQFSARMQTDGNFVVYFQGLNGNSFRAPKAIWATKTNTGKKNHLTITQSGNLVVLEGKTKILWNTQTQGFGICVLRLHDQGNLVLRDSTGKELFNSYKSNGIRVQPKLFKEVVGEVLGEEIHVEKLLKLQAIRSNNLHYSARMQTDGNFVVYHQPKGDWRLSKPIWATGTSGGDNFLSLLSNGNLVVSNGRQTLWETRTRGEAPVLKMQNNGTLALTNKKHETLFLSSKDNGYCY